MPFCAHKCHYCDFYSIVDQQDRQEPFTRRLERELLALAPAAGSLRTIFVGGGTPSMLRVPLWQDVLQTLRMGFDVSQLAEFTVECNPESISSPLVDTLVRGGVTRISMGAQSFNHHHLKTLDRRHDPANVERGLAMVRAAGIRRTNVDLIFAVPGQSMQDWHDDLKRALDLGTEHISAYSLTYEPKTELTARLARGEFSPCDEDLEADMLESTIDVLRSSGFERYEVSNFAKPGEECRHNLAYWRQEEWLAAGPAASAHVRGHRYKNTPRLDDYLAIDDEGFAPIVDHEGPDPKRALTELLMTGVRIREGVDVARVASAAGEIGVDVFDAVKRSANALTRQGLMKADEAKWAPTPKGMSMADHMAVELMRAMEST
ncbi:MAG: radical SAM family heme chaperone HemW [Planctomycetes bacterium]|nr:radical SAM family heme chaperone HemW [Planctomycetota bacterium]